MILRVESSHISDVIITYNNIMVSTAFQLDGMMPACKVAHSHVGYPSRRLQRLAQRMPPSSAHPPKPPLCPAGSPRRVWSNRLKNKRCPLVRQRWTARRHSWLHCRGNKVKQVRRKNKFGMMSAHLASFALSQCHPHGLHIPQRS